MKRLHVHVGVEDLETSIRFYETLFDAAPSVVKPDYAKWMLDDPCVNFAISTARARAGVDHLGIQVEDEGDLARYAESLQQAGRHVVEQKDAVCCYARSDKAWVSDPQGIAWETFFSRGAETEYGEDRVMRSALAGEGETAGGMLEDGPCCTGGKPEEVACCAPAEAAGKQG